MNIRPVALIPTRPTHLEVGILYLLRGTVFNRPVEKLDRELPIPPQLVRIEGKPVLDMVGVGHVPVTLYVDMGRMGKAHFKTLLGLDQVNIPPHGMHNRHLERIPDDLAWAFGVLEEDNRKQDYREMVMGR